MASYLQAVCLAEKRPVERSFLTELAESTQPVDFLDIPDMPVNPLTRPFPGHDLRSTLHELQFLSSTPVACSTRVKTPQERREDLADWSAIDLSTAQDDPGSFALLRRMERHVDAVSYIDSFLTRDPLDTPEVRNICLNICSYLTVGGNYRHYLPMITTLAQTMKSATPTYTTVPLPREA